MFGEFWRRLLFRFRGERFDRDLAEEMRLHLELRAVDEGSEPAARRRFGNQTLLLETSREAWGWSFLETIGQDLRYAARNLNASRGFALVAIASLALGIGANTAIFSILNAVMLRALPIDDPTQLVQVVRSETFTHFTNPLWEAIRDRQTGFSGMAADFSDRFDLAPGGVSEFVPGLMVSGNYFHLLGVPALRGRVLSPEDDRRGGGKSGAVAVISYAFWKNHFAGDVNIVGRIIHLNRHPFQIVGVTPEWFRGLDLDRGYGVAIPIASEPILHTDRSWLDARSTWWLRVIGRLAPGVSLQEERARMNAITAGVYRATVPTDYSPDEKKDYLRWQLIVERAATGFSEAGRTYRNALYALMGVVGLVVLIACANVANLLLARATARQRDIAVRLAIGASRARIVRQLLTESLLLSGISAAVGLLFAVWGSHALVRLLSTTGKELEFDLSIDTHLLLFTIAVATATGLFFGLAPAMGATRVSPNDAMKEGARGTTAGASRVNLNRLLVAGQVALSVILLAGAALFLATMENLLHVDAGFDAHNVLIAGMDVDEATTAKPLRAPQFSRVLDGLRRGPGVISASSSALTPISHMAWDQPVFPLGRKANTSEDEDVYLNRVSDQYFRTMGTPLLLGRDFSERDTLSSPQVIILSETTARGFFGNESPLGKTLGIKVGDGTEKRDPATVIGVVKDAKYQSLDQSANFKTAFLAATQDPDPGAGLNFEIRSRSAPETVEKLVRNVIKQVNSGASIEFHSFETQVNESVRQQEVVAFLSAFFGLLALLLAMIGLYGITAYSVVRRQAEIGIRMALGARQRAVVWLVMRDVMAMLALGAAIGLAGSLALGRLVTSLLFGVKSNDPAALAAAALVLGAATTLAAYIPARRAARLDPMLTLRSE